MTLEKDKNDLVGRRIKLVLCTDQHTKLEPGMHGTVSIVDDLGMLHVAWDNGAGLGLVPGKDQWEVLPDSGVRIGQSYRSNDPRDKHRVGKVIAFRQHPERGEQAQIDWTTGKTWVRVKMLGTTIKRGYTRVMKFRRESDGKVFEMVRLAHWSDIKAEDGETDSVQWIGGDQYVSASKGHGYKLFE